MVLKWGLRKMKGSFIHLKRFRHVFIQKKRNSTLQIHSWQGILLNSCHSHGVICNTELKYLGDTKDNLEEKTTWNIWASSLKSRSLQEAYITHIITMPLQN